MLDLKTRFSLAAVSVLYSCSSAGIYNVRTARRPGMGANLLRRLERERGDNLLWPGWQKLQARSLLKSQRKIEKLFPCRERRKLGSFVFPYTLNILNDRRHR